jgi:hypothetical protein
MKFFAPCLSALYLFCGFASGQDFISDTAAVRLSYSNTPDRKIEGTTTEVGLSQWALMSPIFFHKAESWAFGAGFRYESTNLDFSDASVFDEDNLHSIDLPLFFSKTQSDTLDWMVLFNPTVAGDFEHVTGDSFNYLALAGARWKRSETFEWFFGAVYTTGFDDDLFLPAIGFKWTPSDRSDLFFAGPYVRYRYSLSDSFDLILGGQMSGDRWNTEASYGERDLRLRSYRLSLTGQWNIAEKHAVFASVGAELGREAEIKNALGTTLLEKDLDEAPNFEIGYRFRF